MQGVEEFGFEAKLSGNVQPAAGGTAGIPGVPEPDG